MTDETLQFDADKDMENSLIETSKLIGLSPEMVAAYGRDYGRMLKGQIDNNSETVEYELSDEDYTIVEKKLEDRVFKGFDFYFKIWGLNNERDNLARRRRATTQQRAIKMKYYLVTYKDGTQEVTTTGYANLAPITLLNLFDIVKIELV